MTFARWMVVCMVAVGCAEDGIEQDPSLPVADSGSPAATEDTGLEDDGGDELPAEIGYDDVQPILQAHCTRCHSDPPFGAPFSLASYEDASARASRIVARAVDASPAPMPPGGTVLSDDEAALLVEWEEAGAPR